jgi:hypothetical protein
VGRKIHEIGERPEWANFIHLSSNDLGAEFTFTPRIPRQPFQDIHGDPIEDTITKRTSWAKEPADAVDAISPITSATMYIYGVESLPGEVDCEDEYDSHCKDDLEYEKTYHWNGGEENIVKYGTGWTARDYATNAFKEPADSDTVKDDLELCVPDAPDTNEFWATQPVNAKQVGTYDRRGMLTWYGEGTEFFEESVIREYVRHVLLEARDIVRWLRGVDV